MPLIGPDTPPVRCVPAYFFYQTALRNPYRLGLHDRLGMPRYSASGQSPQPLIVRGGARRDEPQTVEQIIADGYLAVPSGDPVTALLWDREHVSKLGLDDVITQVRQRYEIWQQNLLDLDEARLEAVNALHDWESYFGPASIEMRAALHNTLQRLYQQERDERVSLWKDVSRLRQALPESAQQYLSAHRKISVLELPAGDDR